MKKTAAWREPAGILDIAHKFKLKGRLLSALPFGDGHINDTFLLTTEGGPRYVLQRISRSVFPDPSIMMENMERVISHMRGQGVGSGRGILQLVPVEESGNWLHDAEGALWRCTLFIEGTFCLRRTANRDQAFEAGRVFGEFQKLMSCLPGPSLKPSLPGFHHMPLRLQALKNALNETSDHCQREAEGEIRFIMENQHYAYLLSGFIKDGSMPERITHNDAKMGNLLFDRESGKALCVIDLDTVMPGIALFDLGDLARSASCVAPEGDEHPEKFQACHAFFAALAEGFLAGGGKLTALERENLVEATQAFAYTLGVRYLTDYLLGNNYFKAQSPRQNLERARGQLALLKDLMNQSGELKKILFKQVFRG